MSLAALKERLDTSVPRLPRIFPAFLRVDLSGTSIVFTISLLTNQLNTSFRMFRFLLFPKFFLFISLRNSVL